MFLGFAAVIASAVFAYSPAHAQSLSTASRTVYKCIEGGKAVYSDAPCLGAVKINVEPTRGMNKSTGRELVGNDVRREQHREGFAEAIKPLIGMDAKQLEVQSRRTKLSSDVQHECRRLDREILAAESGERHAARGSLAEFQERLFLMRQRFRDIRC